MFSLQKCRKLIGDDETITDAEIERLRNSLYDLSRAVVAIVPPSPHGRGSRGRTKLTVRPACAHEGHEGYLRQHNQDGDSGIAQVENGVEMAPGNDEN